MKSHCIFPQVLNYIEFEESWLSVLNLVNRKVSQNEELLKK